VRTADVPVRAFLHGLVDVDHRRPVARTFTSRSREAKGNTNLGMGGPIVLLAIVLLGCVGRPGADHYASVLDTLKVPASWELVHTTVREPGAAVSCETFVNPDCPSVHRFYRVEGMPAAAYQKAKDMLTGAGFTIDEEYHPACDGIPGGAACRVTGVKEADRVLVYLHDPGEDVDELGIAESGYSVIEVRANRKQ